MTQIQVTYSAFRGRWLVFEAGHLLGAFTSRFEAEHFARSKGFTRRYGV